MCYYINNMKRIIPVILLLLTLTGCYNSGEPRERVLKIYFSFLGYNSAETTFKVSAAKQDIGKIELRPGFLKIVFRFCHRACL